MYRVVCENFLEFSCFCMRNRKNKARNKICSGSRGKNSAYFGLDFEERKNRNKFESYKALMQLMTPSQPLTTNNIKFAKLFLSKVCRRVASFHFSYNFPVMASIPCFHSFIFCITCWLQKQK